MMYLVGSDKSSRNVIISNNWNSFCVCFVGAAEPLRLYALLLCFSFAYLSFNQFHLFLITGTEQTPEVNQFYTENKIII